MMRFLLLLVFASVTAFGQSTYVGPAAPTDYVVNQVSLATSLSWADPVSPTEFDRTLSWAGNYWTANAGSRRYFRKVGNSTNVNCDAFNVRNPELVAGQVWCAPGDTNCTIVAFTAWCGAITVYGGNQNPNGSLAVRKFTMVPPKADTPSTKFFSFEYLMVHEFGHLVFQLGAGFDGKGHIPNQAIDDCTMKAPNDGNFVGLCIPEIRNVGRSQSGLTGYGYLNTPLVKTGAPESTMAWSTPATTAITTGIGGAEVAVGTDPINPMIETAANLTTVVSVPTSGPHNAVFTDNNNAWSGSLISDAVQRPSIVWDPTTNCWWMFARTSYDLNRIRVFKGCPGTNGVVDKGLLSFSTSSLMRTKYPVAAAYSPLSQSIVLVWTSFEGVNDFEGSCNVFHPGFDPPGWAPHCRNEVLAANLVPNLSTGNIDVTQVQRFVGSGKPASAFGYVSLAGPSVVCENNGLCEIYAINWTQWKEISTWTLYVGYWGFAGYTPQVSERVNSPGETDYSVAVSSRRNNGTGGIVEAVTGGNHVVYWRSKPSITSAYSGWTPLPAPLALSSPSVRRHLVSDSYTMFYAKE